MNSCKNHSNIEIEIANISDIINNQQKDVNTLSATRNHQPTNITSNFEESLKEKQLKLIRLIKQKIKLENKLQSVHDERYNEFVKSNVFNGVSDVMNMIFITLHIHPTRPHHHRQCHHLCRPYLPYPVHLTLLPLPLLHRSQTY